MPVGIAFDEASFRRVVNRYRDSPTRVALVQRGLVAWAMTEGVRQAQRFIDQLVYNAPIPRSGYRRTRATRRAISKREGISWYRGVGAGGEIHVDRFVANRDGFYYPAILNRGRSDIRYYPRPFWSATAAVMRVRYREHGEAALRELKQRLLID